MNSGKVICVVQARTSSERLPGKVLLPLAGRTVLEHVLRAALTVETIDQVVMATSRNAADEVLCEIAESVGVRAFQGPESDVLERFLGAIRGAGASTVVRVTADDPLLDPEVVNKVVAAFCAGAWDYGSNILRRTWPRGMDTEVFTRESLEVSSRSGLAPEYREHVTTYIRTHPEEFRLLNVEAPPREWWPELRLCVDTKEDYEMLSHVFDALHRDGQAPPVSRVVDWLREHPEIAALNRDVRQKAVFGRQL